MEAEKVIEASDQELCYRLTHYHHIRVVKDRPSVCGSCGNVIVLEEGRIFSHPVVGILQCEKCEEAFKDLSFKAIKNGARYCRICGHSKSLQDCADKKCPFSFCRICVRRNASLSLLDIDSGVWKCFACEPKPLWELRAVCVAAMASLPKTKRKRFRRSKETGLVSSYARRKLAKVEELKSSVKGVCDEDTSSGDSKPSFSLRSNYNKMYSCDDISEFSPGEGPSPLRPKNPPNPINPSFQTENSDSPSPTRGRSTKNGCLSRSDRKRSKSANVSRESEIPGRSGKSRRSHSALRDQEAGSSSGKEFQKSKISTESMMLRRMWSKKKDTKDTDDDRMIIGKQQRLRFKAKVVKILNRFKDACSEYELKMEHLKWRHFKRELTYKENADMVVDKSRNLMSRMRTELERQERELATFHRSWIEGCRWQEKASSCSSENEDSDKEVPEKQVTREISVSECDGEEIFSEKEENVKSPEKINKESDKQRKNQHEKTPTSPKVPSPILGSTKKANPESTKSNSENEKLISPISENPMNDSMNDMFETSFEQENVKDPTEEDNVEESQVDEVQNEPADLWIQQPTDESDEKLSKEASNSSEQIETSDGVSKERHGKDRDPRGSLNEDERAKMAMLESDSEFQDEFEGSKDSEEKTEESAKRTALESEDSNSIRDSERRDSDSENVRAKKALLVSSNSESSSEESRETSKSKSKDSKSDEKSRKRNHSDSDTSVGARVKKRRLKMGVKHKFGDDEKLRMSCHVVIEKISGEELHKFAHVLEKFRKRVDSRTIESLIDLEKLERLRTDPTKNETRTAPKTSKRKSKREEEEEETLLDHLKKVENGGPLSEMDQEAEEMEQIDKDDVPLAQEKNLGLQTNEELMLEADKATKELLLNSSDSEIDQEKNECENECQKESENENNIPLSKKKNEEKSFKKEMSKEEIEKSSWRRNPILTMRLSDSNSEEEKEKWEKKQRQSQVKSEDEKLDSEDVKETKRKKQMRRRILDSDSDVQLMDSESDSSVILQEEEESSDSSKKKKKKKVRKRATCKSTDTDSSLGSKKSKPKRRRIKKMASDSDSESGSDNVTSSQGTPGKKGRKNIRKVMKDKQVTDDTKLAAKEEEERLKRIAERQKLYNEMYEARLAGETKVDKLVLDFDPATKEELVSVHQDLVKRLKPHQAEGIKFMWNACFESLERTKTTCGSGCIIAHCMGLGKTLQVISLAHTLLTNEKTGVKTIMVVCPLSTVLNWVQEFEYWLKDVDSPEIEVCELTKLKKNFERKFQLKNWQKTGGVLIIGYEMFRNLSGPNKNIRKNMKEEIQQCLIDPGPDVVVCDEGHLLKNEETALSKCMAKIKTLRRIVLTGTPLQNNLIEYHCMVQFVKPNLLGTKREFLNRFANPITNGQFDDSTASDVKLMKKRAYVLHKMLKGSVQRFDYSVLMPFLPPKQEYVIFVRLTDEQIKMYRHYLDNFARRQRAAGSSLFADFQALQRIWTHPTVLKLNAERTEKANERKRLSSESEGSLKDFINDDSESSSWKSSSSSNCSSDDDVQEVSDSKQTSSSSRKKRNQEPEVAEATEEAEEYTEDKNWWSQFITPEHFNETRASSKLLLLFGILKECEQIGDKVLVFSQSLFSLTLIEMFLRKIDEATQNGTSPEELDSHTGSWSLGLDYFRLDGQTSAENRNMWCKIFNRPTNTRARLFLISTRAGGLGINLTAANRVIIFDASWNPSHDVQSIFRIYRFGQKKPCYVYRFLAAGTMEEKIYNRQVTKLSLSCRVVDEQQIERHYSNNDLNELYKFEPNVSGEKPTLNLPKDRLLAEIFLKYKDHVENYHEHDSLLENKAEEELDEEERKQAWLEYEEEKKGKPVQPYVHMGSFQNSHMVNQYGIGKPPNISSQDYENLQQLIRKDYPNATPEQQKAITTRAFMEMYNYLEQQAIVQAANTYNAHNVNRVKQLVVRPQMHKPIHSVQNMPQNLQPVQQNLQNVQSLQNIQNLQNTQSSQSVTKNLVPNIYVYKNNDAGGSASVDDDIVELSTNVTTPQNPEQSKGKNQEE